MKLSLQWLQEFVDCPWGGRELGERLTMAGFELEGMARAAPPFSGVVVAEIISCAKHPQADKLQVCQVSTGSGSALQVVCGASNARAGLRTALANIGAVLPGDLRIKAAQLRGVDSAGMLCSGRELGLADASDGIIELPADMALGTDVRVAMGLDDEILEIAVTPNRGDAMSVLGLAREVAALAGAQLRAPAQAVATVQHQANVPVTLVNGAGCGRFAARLIRGVNNRAPTPLWLRERLRRAGLRSISPVVDVTNYVLQELGQPMHAYDAAKLRGGITVRKARPQESLVLLDGKAVALADDMLVIADDGGAVGLAGVMGGERTAVSDATTDVFFEVAWFEPQAIAGRARRIGLTTDASQRYERGVDPGLQERAMERATQLLLQIAGGEAGPLAVHRSQDPLPARPAVALRRSQLARLLGLQPDAGVVAAKLKALGMQVDATADGWRVTPPAHRFDIAIEADLIEEVGREIGLAAIPESAPRVRQVFAPLPEAQAGETRILDLLAARGYQEAIHFAFVDPALQQRLFPAASGVRLANPIADNLAVMRVSLWPALLQATADNFRRQQDRVRLFELGSVFDGTGTETDMVAGVIAGPRHAEQWATPRDETKLAADFYDLRADVSALLSISGDPTAYEFRPGGPPCLHPGRCATLLKAGVVVGSLGELHPDQVAALDLTYAPLVFELRHDALAPQLPTIADISRQPQVRRDLAVVVDEGVTFGQLRERVTSVASGLLRDLRCFDVYRGAGVESGRKSIALGLIFQDNLKTLTDEDADRLMAGIRSDLGASLNARIRE